MPTTVYTAICHPIEEDNDSTFTVVAATEAEAEAKLLEVLVDFGEEYDSVADIDPTQYYWRIDDLPL